MSYSGGEQPSDEPAALDDQRTARRLRVLTKVTQFLCDGGRSTERLLQLVVRELGRTDDTGCGIALITEDDQHFTVPYAFTADPRMLAAFRARLGDDVPHRIETHPVLRHVTAARTPWFLPRVVVQAEGSSDERARTALGVVSALDVTSLLMVPLIVRGRVMGAIGVARIGEKSSPLDEHDLSLTQSVAEHVALALTAAQLLEGSEREIAERKRMAERLRLLAETSREVAETTAAYDGVLALVARRLSEVFGDLCSVRAIDEDGRMLERGPVYHPDPTVVAWVEGLVAQPQRLEEGLAGRVASSGEVLFKPVLTPDDWAGTTPIGRQILERLRVGSTMAVPLKCRGEAVGVVSLLRSGSSNPYTNDDLHFVQSVADRAALAIINARSHAAARAARAAEDKAREARRLADGGLRLLFEASPVPVLAFSVASLDILAVNRAALRLYGYSRDEMLAMKLSDLRVDMDEAGIRAIVVAAGDGDATGIAQQRRRDGSLMFAEYHSHLVELFGHRARLTVMTDITSRHEAERVRSLLSAIVESSNDAIISKDLRGTITSWNRAAERLFGYSASEAIGKPIHMLYPPEARADEATLLTRIAAGERINDYETVRRRKDGSSVYVALSLSPILDPAGKVIGASKSARDLSAQVESAEALRRTEEQLRQAQKMDAVGRLAGGIAHDFNNALSVILGCSGLILRDLESNDPTREDVDEIRLAAERAADLTRQLLLFSRQQVIAPRVIDLNQVLKDMDKMLRRIIGEDIDLLSLPAARIGHILADPSHVNQVIMNLVVNARDAMPTGGKLTIETSDVELDAEYAAEHLGTQPGPYVMLAVSDTGYGMSKATQMRIFEPFFTTKEQGKGTGLGLSTVFGILQQAGGSVWVYSELGKGTTFKVYFPRVDGEVDAPARSRASALVRGTETVLLVEDQDNVRAIAHAILKRSGYRVLVARAAGDALVLCERHRDSIDLLLTDVVMPHLSGIELAARIARTQPQIKVLYMSGYTDDSVVRHGVLESEMAFLQKPFTPESLSAKVREVLHGPYLLAE